MAIKVYKLEEGNYALVDSSEVEKIKTIDDLKSQNLLLSIVGGGLAIPAAIVTSGALATLLTGVGVYVTVQTMFNTEHIRQLEGKDIDVMYLLNQGLAIPGVLLPGASMAARGERINSENGTKDDIPKTINPPDATTTNTVAPSFSVTESLYDFSGNSVMSGWLASWKDAASLYQPIDTVNNTSFFLGAVSPSTEWKVRLFIGDKEVDSSGVSVTAY